MPHKPTMEKRTKVTASRDSLPDIVQTAFVFAARYVHHRDTGGTLAICKALAYVWPELSEQIKEQIIRESHEATTNLREWREFRGDEEEGD
jgi:hypothetical protein